LTVLIETPNEPKQPTQRRPSKGSRHRWHAVLIVAPSSACAAAQACKGKRYFSSEAPRLPLANCDAASCGCKYRHFDDRRAGPRRAEEVGPDVKRPASNRRTRKGRRAVD
jgi:hypothetical protein